MEDVTDGKLFMSYEISQSTQQIVSRQTKKKRRGREGERVRKKRSRERERQRETFVLNQIHTSSLKPNICSQFI